MPRMPPRTQRCQSSVVMGVKSLGCTGWCVTSINSPLELRILLFRGITSNKQRSWFNAQECEQFPHSLILDRGAMQNQGHGDPLTFCVTFKHFDVSLVRLPMVYTVFVILLSWLWVRGQAGAQCSAQGHISREDGFLAALRSSGYRRVIKSPVAKS